MSYRSGSNSHRRQSRDAEDYPPVPRLPSLRALGVQRDRDNASPTSSIRPQSRHVSAASRRAERIRNLENRDPSLDDFFRPSDEGWPTASRRADRMRPTIPPDASRTSEYDHFERPYDDPNSHIRLLVDLQNQMPPDYDLSMPGFSPPPRPQDLPDSSRRHKRRKLDSDRLVPSFKGFRYGKYGQVEPGQLQMEIVSCDGGMFSDESSYAAENILKDDTSVYCTKGNRCNIVLRHQGATVFTLQELVIKAPASVNYSHPVREGMVFIAMNQDDILDRTARYQIQYAPRTNEESRTAHDSSLLTLHQYEDDDPMAMRPRGSFRPVFHRSRDDEEPRKPQMPPEFASDLPDFRITIECSEEEEDDDPSLRFSRRAPNHIGSLPFETQDSADEDDESGIPSFAPTDYHHNPRHPPHWRLYSNNMLTPPIGENTGYTRWANRELTRNRDRDRDRERERDLHEAREAYDSAHQDAIRAVGGGELLTPHARFFIEKKKSKCTIRFDPPVSGRFILLKMWSSHHDLTSNIDIQSIIARGFAGPRYFPSVDLR